MRKLACLNAPFPATEGAAHIAFNLSEVANCEALSPCLHCWNRPSQVLADSESPGTLQPHPKCRPVLR